jgi:polar amino acid transport system permease protein
VDSLIHFQFIAAGLKITLLYAFISLLCGFLLAIPLAFCKTSRFWALRAFAAAYVSVFRGTPLLLQLMIIYNALPPLTGIVLSGFSAAILAFSLNSAAYVSVILVGGIRAIDPGQFEAAKALGVSYPLMMRDIILPQVLRNVFPSLVNESVDLLKESSLVSIIGEADIMRRAQMVSGQTYDYLGPLMMAGCCYYVLVMALSSLAKLLEKRHRHDPL